MVARPWIRCGDGNPKMNVDMKHKSLLCLVLLVGFVFTAAAQPPLRLSKVKLSNKTFFPSKGEYAEISFETNQTADIQVAIYDSTSSLVTNIKIPNAGAGWHVARWDGRRDNGEKSHGNRFLYVIRAVSEAGEVVLYNPAAKTGGILVKVRDYTYNKENGRIEYVLPKACMVRLRAGLKEGMLLRTLLDWQPRQAGRHTMQWDGKDGTGQFDLSRHPDLELKLTCYTLPDNTIIVSEGTLEAGSSMSAAAADVWHANDKKKYIHYRHDPRLCHEPAFLVSFPKSPANQDSLPVLTGSVPVRITLDARDKTDLINKRFEIMLYVDGVFLFEMEEGTSPFTFHWNTQNFARGSHILTVNIMSYDDHVGVVSRDVIVGE